MQKEFRFSQQTKIINLSSNKISLENFSRYCTVVQNLLRLFIILAYTKITKWK